MVETQSPKRYDLEDRTLKFAGAVRMFVQKLPKGISNIEANEALSKKDFLNQ